MTEEQLSQLEGICLTELKKQVAANQRNGVVNDHVPVKRLTDSLLKKLGLMDEIRSMLF